MRVWLVVCEFPVPEVREFEEDAGLSSFFIPDCDVRDWLGFESSVPGVQGFEVDFSLSSVLVPVSALYWDGCVWLGCEFPVPEVCEFDVDCEVLFLFIRVLSLDRYPVWLDCGFCVVVEVFDIDCEVLLSLFTPVVLLLYWYVPVWLRCGFCVVVEGVRGFDLTPSPFTGFFWPET